MPERFVTSSAPPALPCVAPVAGLPVAAPAVLSTPVPAAPLAGCGVWWLQAAPVPWPYGLAPGGGCAAVL